MTAFEQWAGSTPEFGGVTGMAILGPHRLPPPPDPSTWEGRMAIRARERARAWQELPVDAIMGDQPGRVAFAELRPGDPDPTRYLPPGTDWCGDRSPDDWACTLLLPQHGGCQHIAGDGRCVVAVWETEPTEPTDIVDAITSAIGCQQCGSSLDRSPSDDFCSDLCQQAWAARRVGADVDRGEYSAWADRHHSDALGLDDRRVQIRPGSALAEARRRAGEPYQGNAELARDWPALAVAAASRPNPPACDGHWPAELVQEMRDTAERNAHIPGWTQAQRFAVDLLTQESPPPELGFAIGYHRFTCKTYVHADAQIWFYVYKDEDGHVVAAGRPKPLSTLYWPHVSISR